MAIRKHRNALLAGAIATIAATGLAGIALGAHHHTYAAYSDFVDVHAGATAGVWTPDPPEGCGPLSGYSRIVYGTSGDDTIDGVTGAARVVDLKHGGNREIIMGLGGDDDLSGGNGTDCIVGGDGDDVLHGDNGKDVLLGGAGDDQLLGSNSPDLLDGGPGDDLCVGGRTSDVFQNCERVVMDRTHVNQAKALTSASPTDPEPAPSNANSSIPTAPSSSGSSSSDAPAESPKAPESTDATAPTADESSDTPSS